MLVRKSSLEIMRCVLINQFITTVICIYKYLYYYNNIIIIHVAYNRWISVSKVNKKSRLFPNSLIHINFVLFFLEPGLWCLWKRFVSVGGKEEICEGGPILILICIDFNNIPLLKIYNFLYLYVSCWFKFQDHKIISCLS